MDKWEEILNNTFEKISEVEDKKQSEKEKAEQNRAKAKNFVSSVVAPAFEEIKPSLEMHNQKVSITTGETYDKKEQYATITVKPNDPSSRLRFVYQLTFVPYPNDILISYHGKFVDEIGYEYELVPSGQIPSGITGNDISKISKDEIKEDFVLKYQYMVESHLE
ncbi:MAG: hypothetical protein WCE81_08910 [Halobacteriota archaeon]